MKAFCKIYQRFFRLNREVGENKENAHDGTYKYQEYETSVANSGLFDFAWYESEYNVKDEHIKHYLTQGWKEGKVPSKKFDGDLYLERCPDVAASGMNPLVHYILHGQFEKRTSGIVVEEDSVPSELEVIAEAGQQLESPEMLFAPTVVIVAELSIKQCEKYRVNQGRYLFDKAGFRTKICSYHSKSQVINYMQVATHVYFYRVPNGELLELYMEEVKRLGLKSIYDIDDPMFDKEVILSNLNFTKLDDTIQNNVILSAAVYSEALLYFDKCVVSTQGMKDVILNHGFTGDVIIRQNAVDGEMVRINSYLKKSDNQLSSKSIVELFYATPSLAHNFDFELISPTIKKILHRYSGQVRLVLMGNVEIPKILEPVSDYTDIFPAENYSSYLEVMKSVDINLVPLAQCTFNKCKSNIKFLDAAIAEKPSVCSAIGDYLLLSHEQDCILVENEQLWFEYLTDLIENEEKRILLGQNAWETAKSQFLLDDKIYNDFSPKMQKLGFFHG